MDSYPVVPLTELRDRLGKVVRGAADQPTIITEKGEPIAVIVSPDVLRSDLLPPGYFNEATRGELIAALDGRIAEAPPADQAAAEAWAARAFAADHNAHDAA